MAVMATIYYLLAAFFAPKKGVIAKFLARRGQQQKIEIEDLLKQSFKLHRSGTLNLAALSQQLDLELALVPRRSSEQAANAIKAGTFFRLSGEPDQPDE